VLDIAALFDVRVILLWGLPDVEPRQLGVDRDSK